MEAFSYTGLPSRVVFGVGKISHLADEAARLGGERTIIVSTKEQSELAERCHGLLGDRAVGIFSGAVMHTPTDVTEAAVAYIKSCAADLIVSVGGGSTIGLGKAVAIRTSARHLVIPTTYAGSEATPILGETKNGVKSTIRDPKILADIILYDVELTLSLPKELSVTSGINAIAHAVEALYAVDRNPVTSQMAETAIRAMVRALPAIVADPRDVPARSDALFAAWLSGVCLGTVGMSLHHKLCHVLGGTFDLPHAAVHTIMLPHVMAYNAGYMGSGTAYLRRALGSEHPARALWDLEVALKAPTALRDIGLEKKDIARVLDQTFSKPYWNPRTPNRGELEQLLEQAWAGEPPLDSTH